MKGAVIALDTIQGHEAAALIEDGRLNDLLIDCAGPRPGTIYRARIGRPAKGQGGMFLDTPDGTAFLRQTRGLSPGAPLLVQVTGHAEPGKALPVTAKLLFKSRYAIVTPGAPGINVSRQIRDDDMRDRLLEIAHATLDGVKTGLILRSAAADADEDAIAEDIRAMAELATQVLGDAEGPPEKLVDGDGPHALAWRDWTVPATLVQEPGAFADHGVTDAIEALRNPESPLPGGGSIVVEPTRALVAVDINTGGDTSPAAGLKANIAAARELPRQLRLRGLGGQITLDLAPMAKKDRRGFETALKAALRRDSIETTAVGWTPLGHFELQRKRERVPIREVLK
ncbi:ribonuclease E/G [Roseovarius amoyensis]|uniref:ribonuclease E/G n=1 Tax=Roseovarius amoyensis TaxID=2211448 RepID=UPI000DBE373F|nr:ribonuclease E/G [Roseovarius amoyensis]